MNLDQAKEQIAKEESEKAKNRTKIFYADPCNENDCAQCGKPKSEHYDWSKDGVPLMLFCNPNVDYNVSHHDMEIKAYQLVLSSKDKEIAELKEKLKEKSLLLTACEVGFQDMRDGRNIAVKEKNELQSELSQLKEENETNKKYGWKMRGRTCKTCGYSACICRTPIGF